MDRTAYTRRVRELCCLSPDVPLGGKKKKVILITDPGKDLDDEQAMILLAGLEHAGIIEL